jgi:predicted DNA-binding WGR domain protein
MDHMLLICIEAHHAEKNHHRRYQVTLGRDLLDDWTVSIRYGRTGQAGRELRYAAREPDAIRAVIRDRLRRRLSAPRRLGCPYRLTAFSAPPGFDASSWLPGDVMARFFQATRSDKRASEPFRAPATTGVPPGSNRPLTIRWCPNLVPMS